MLNVGKLHEALEGMDPDAPIVVGIIEGHEYDPAYAEQRVFAGKLSLYICCYEEPRPWEGTTPPTLNEDGTMTLRYDPKDETKED